jgi:phospholipase C
MNRRNWWKSTCSLAGIIAMLQPIAASAAVTQQLTAQPRSSALVARYASHLDNEPVLSHAQKLMLLQKNIKYVFVLFQENRSFDYHFGTFPGAKGYFSQPAAQTAGLTQSIVDCGPTITGSCANPGATLSQTTFLIPQTVKNTAGQTVQIYPADTISVDHSHAGINNSLDPVNGVYQNDRYALDEEGLTTSGGQIVSLSTGLPATSPPTLAQKQKGEIVMAHDDCDTVPFLWQFADRFVLFDNFFQTIIGPSTPNAIALIAGQSGVTQWALHPDVGSNNTGSPVVQESGGQPVVGDGATFPGSNLDQSPIKPAINTGDENPNKPVLNQTYASLPLSFMQNGITATVQSDENPAIDLPDVQADIKTIANEGNLPVSWGWYQEGYDHEPTDGSGPATHATYVWHHNGPEYFGYVGDNPTVASNLHGLGDFYTAVSNQALPSAGGVFYVRGGYGNNDGLVPVDPNPAVQSAFAGSDDHASYSDAQISESLVADEVNAIASSPYWANSAIIITYDETDGDYDQAQPGLRQLDPEGNPLTPGPRIPAIVISPYAAAHVVSHEYGEHSSVIKFINELFKLKPLADLPDEKKGKQLGLSEFNQPSLEPSDGSDSPAGDLFSAFDNGRLSGVTLPLPASYAMIPQSAVISLPHYASTGGGCYTLNIVPTDYQNGTLIDPAPSDFNPRPTLTPGIPTQPGWTP